MPLAFWPDPIPWIATVSAIPKIALATPSAATAGPGLATNVDAPNDGLPVPTWISGGVTRVISAARVSRAWSAGVSCAASRTVGYVVDDMTLLLLSQMDSQTMA